MVPSRFRRSVRTSEFVTGCGLGSQTTRQIAHHCAAVGAVARDPLGLPPHLEPRPAVGRVVAIDLPGFGHSDGRPELIAPDSSGAFLARMIDEWGLGAPHVVGPDVGRPRRSSLLRRLQNASPA